MGGRQSRVADATLPGKDQESGFSVTVSPGLVEALEGPPGKPEVVTTHEEAAEIREAYRKGAADAEANLRAHIVSLRDQYTKEQLDRESRVAAHLAEKVEDFRARKFSPPQRPVACEEEAAKLVSCYREKKGAEDGEGALACRSLVDVYEECARKIVQAIDVTKAQ